MGVRLLRKEYARQREVQGVPHFEEELWGQSGGSQLSKGGML